jgi:hypothetical protein
VKLTQPEERVKYLRIKDTITVTRMVPVDADHYGFLAEGLSEQVKEFAGFDLAEEAAKYERDGDEESRWVAVLEYVQNVDEENADTVNHKTDVDIVDELHPATDYVDYDQIEKDNLGVEHDEGVETDDDGNLVVKL